LGSVTGAEPLTKLYAAVTPQFPQLWVQLRMGFWQKAWLLSMERAKTGANPEKANEIKRTPNNKSVNFDAFFDKPKLLQISILRLLTPQPDSVFRRQNNHPKKILMGLLILSL
jgi:hypothetical protein